MIDSTSRTGKTTRKRAKRCQHCHKPVDEKSQITFLQKTFCSVRCLVKSVLESTFALFKIKIKFSQQQLFPSFAYIFAFVFALALIGLLMAMLINIRQLREELRILNAQQSIVALQARESQKEKQIPPVSITQAPDAMVRQNKITITGEAGRNIILSLTVNGELKQVTLPEKNKFRFENIVLNYGSNDIIVRGLDADGNSVILEKLTTFYGTPRLNYLARDFTRGNIHEAKIALTFDGGAGNGAANKILDYLSAKGVHCTMFLTGNFIKNYPDLVRRIVHDGHEVGNHTWSHPHLTSFAQNGRHNTLPDMTRERLQEELLKTARAFEKLTGTKMAPYWRAPYGEHNAEIRRWAAEIGYTQVGWTMGNGKGETMDTLDWVADTTASTYHSSHEILEKILNFGHDSEFGANGGIILMHLDTQRNNDQVYEIIPTLIDSLRARGYEFVTISKLMQG